MTNKPSRARAPLWLSFFLVAWIAVVVAAVVWAVPHEEQNLSERTRAALADQPVTVEFEGRDAVLSGQVADSADLDRAMATVREVRGVRRVDSAGVTIAVAPPVTSIPLAPPQVTVAVVEGKASLSGTVADQATADAMLQAAVTRWGADNVINTLQVDPGTGGAPWLAGIVSAIDRLGSLDSANLVISGGSATVAGTVPSADVATSLATEIAALLGPDTPVTNNLGVSELDSPSFEAESIEDGMIRLRGVMPDKQTIDQIVAAAAGVYGSANVIDEMSIGTVQAPDYLAALPSMFGAIEGLTPWSLNVENGAATIEGQAISEDAIAATESRLATAFGAAGLPLSSDLAVDPNAVATVLTQLLEGTASFRVGSSELSPEATDLLDEAVEILLANPETRLRVEGHTDDVGSDEDNLALSEARAQAVVDYLVAGGVAEDRLVAVGFGETTPIADNSTADGRAMNRRIEFVVEQGDS